MSSDDSLLSALYPLLYISKYLFFQITTPDASDVCNYGHKIPADGYRLCVIPVTSRTRINCQITCQVTCQIACPIWTHPCWLGSVDCVYCIPYYIAGVAIVVAFCCTTGVIHESPFFFTSFHKYPFMCRHIPKRSYGRTERRNRVFVWTTCQSSRKRWIIPFANGAPKLN